MEEKSDVCYATRVKKRSSPSERDSNCLYEIEERDVKEKSVLLYAEKGRRQQKRSYRVTQLGLVKNEPSRQHYGLLVCKVTMQHAGALLLLTQGHSTYLPIIYKTCLILH
jgi:hypothetical protein